MIRNREITASNDNLPLLARSALARNQNDFLSKWREIKGEEGFRHGGQSPAGVLLLLHRRPHDGPDCQKGQNPWVWQLIKRSSQTAQGGDIGCPGGMLQRLVDWGFSLLFIRSGILPMPFSPREDASMGASRQERRVLSLFFANALRESWEELRLHPFRVSLLGALPTHSLNLFRRTIFPLVALTDTQWTPRPNHEVERFIEIPLESFFTPSSYGRYLIQASEQVTPADPGPWEFPCLIHEQDGREEILWGATFYIIMNFMKMVFDHRLPDLNDKRIRRRMLHAEYLTGRR
ncbi:MAG: hypothetical protein QM278_03895 [Pseudomonadota bacterium]|nr:hypothetical protein [Pseudomonadota bacterium]